MLNLDTIATELSHIRITRVQQSHYLFTIYPTNLSGGDANSVVSHFQSIPTELRFIPKPNAFELFSAEITKLTHNFNGEANDMKCTRNFGSKICVEDINWGEPRR